MRGNRRTGGDYLAQRGWYAREVRRVIYKWSYEIDPELIRDVFLRMERIAEGRGVGPDDGYNITINKLEHLEFCYELQQALDKLFCRENSAGWVVKLCGRLRPTDWSLMTFAAMADEIVACNGPRFTEDALKKAAQRLRLSR